VDNLILGDDDRGDDDQFLIGYKFQSTEKYVLVVTTHDPEVMGPILILTEGPKTVTFTTNPPIKCE
jgi:hypothetical protein